jgi:hypothetical protein
VATQRYRVTVRGVRTVLRLSAEDARLYPGAELVDGAPAEEVGPAAKRRAAARNKARTAQINKAEE